MEGFRLRRPGKNDQEMLAELVGRQIIARTDLERCNELTLESAVSTLFLWRNGLFEVEAGRVVAEGGVPVTVDANHVIIEGTRRVDEWIEISPVVPSVLVIFRLRSWADEEAGALPERPREVHALVDGQRDVATIARAIGISQFEAAKRLDDLVKAGQAEAIPPNRQKVSELFNLAVESIDVKLVLFDHSRDALLFESQLNRFAVEHGLKVRMAAGKIPRGDPETPMEPTELVDLSKLFIGIQNNKFGKTCEPRVTQGMMEGMYLHSDPEMQGMMRIDEFIEIEGLLLLDVFDRDDDRR